jgi:hypothetical protein
MAQPIKLAGEQLFEISLIDSANKFKASTQKGKDGKTFSRYRYEQTIFTVDNDNPFVADFIAGNVKAVKLIEGERDVENVDDAGEITISTVKSLAFDSYVSRAQYNSLQQDRMLDAKVDATIARFQHLATAPVTSDLLAELENA